jgi:nucleotide-binding universal stress UspA family protein
LMMGSVADTLVRTAPCPVLTIRVPHVEETKTRRAA